MQQGNFVGSTPIYQGKLLLENTIQILLNARKFGCPIIFVQNMGSKGDPDEPNTEGWNIHPKLQIIDRDTIIQKTTPDAFYNTKLNQKLTELKIEHLIILGLQTEYCIDTTVRRAYSKGFQVTLVSDCHSTWDSDVLTSPQIIKHHNLVLSGFFAKLVTTEELYSALSS